MTSTRLIDTPAALRAVMGTDFEFSAQQFAAISAPLAPAVVIAGAGSGKTEVMAARVVYLVATGQVRPEQVLGLTFTTKAASELLARVRGSLRRAGLLGEPGAAASGEAGEEQQEPTVATYNAYAANLLTEHGLRIGHEPDTRVVADASRYQLAARAISRHRRSVTALTDHLDTVIGYLLALDGQLAEHLVSPEQLRAWQGAERPWWAAAEPGPKGGRGKIDAILSAFDRREELLGLVEDYRRLKADLGLMDFSDQIALGARLATECPEVGQLERDRYAVVLLDEYQDTSVAQASMLSALFSGPSPEQGLGHAVTAVGDPNQAIYGWRGASVSNILGFAEDFPPLTAAPMAALMTARGTAAPEALAPAAVAPGAAALGVALPADARPGAEAVYTLTVNRRSDRRILATANHLATSLYADARTRSARLEPKPEAGQGRVRAALLETYDDELAFVAEQVVAAHAQRPDLAWRDIGVLTRDNAHAADVYDALIGAGVPVEIVGINGLLRLPEVAEVVATLTLLNDLTANAAVLTLLSGPRWAIGPRDLSLLGQRARELARVGGGRDDDRPVEEQLAALAEGTDPTELVSLSDALDDPGPAAYSGQARVRFAELSTELRHLRTFAGEPLLDLIRRIIDVTGIELELAASAQATAESRRENLDTFVKAVADFQSLDGQVSLPALLAYLQAEDELGNGLDAATPSITDSVKLLTVHRAKGLEWDVVFLPGLCATKFPNTTGRTSWVRGPAVLPSPLRGDADDLPQVEDYTEAALGEYPKRAKEHDATEQLRLGYVAFTRARHEMVLSGHWWKPGRKKPLGPSPYLTAAVEAMRGWGETPEAWCPPPEDDAVNPVLEDATVHPWPVEPDGEEVARRQRAAVLVREALAAPELVSVEQAGGLSPEEAELVATWDVELDRLVQEAREARADTIEVALPSSLSATTVARLRDDPQRLAAELARPMPRRPSPAARFGTRFHAWVESRFGQQQLVGLDEVPGRADAGIDDEDDFRALVEKFNAGPFAERVPAAIEAPFALVLGGQVVRGRIDAAYRDDVNRGQAASSDPGPVGGAPLGGATRGASGGVSGGAPRHLVVDWKTGRGQDADPLQLAVYRLAWAELQQVPVEQVDAAFYYVRSGELVQPTDLPDRAELERLFSAR